MKRTSRRVLGALTFIAALAGAGAGMAQVPRALSDSDRLSYTTAFDALRRGQLDAAREMARDIQDRVLLGQLEFERLFHANHSATYEELSAWLESYADLSPAPRVYALALRRRPDGAPEPRRPGVMASLRNWASIQAAGGEAVGQDIFTPPGPREARIALNADDLPRAYELGIALGDHWTAGLAAWRMGRLAEAFSEFEIVALDPLEDPWVRSGGAFWASRAAYASGRQDRVQEYLRLAGRWPATFYGQIALRQLGEDPVIENLGPQPYMAVIAAADRAPEPMAVEADALAAFVASNDQARRAVAFHELGRPEEAQTELRNGLRRASDDDRTLWAALARGLAPRRGLSSAARIDANAYPMPVLEPEGGFTIERALVYAIARKESGFEPQARSSVGAYGIMQVMPTTAAELAGDPGFVRDPQRLWNPAVNLRLGQAYIARMLSMGAFQGDLLRAVASYNAGPGPMLGALRRLGPNPDPLLLIETIDVPQARAYVEDVVATYWIYQRMMGRPLNTLDAVASGATHIPLALDHVPSQPGGALDSGLSSETR
ncbi:lytic transglycosylase domain-containing protein [Brevundimonas sp.]|uniref:lytic transglycosylase domain-containing protein n=1 Tax=Brevundimonas sp. TaxID=1871086 RepID=UPI001DA580B4|nr:lytic transglycosylase domain-containing protein [Brevundimonas sp.]MBA3998970.1 transglycosylase [Brevundimonas sp.]